MRRLLFLLPLLTLCGCQFFRTAFPDYLTLIGGQASLGAEISTMDAHSNTLSSVTTPTIDLVFFATSQPVAGTALYVMDGNLNVLQRFTYAELVTIFGGALPSSPRAILDLAGTWRSWA